MHSASSERKRVMSKINQAIHNIHFLDEAAEQDKWLCHIHPLAKVSVTLWYMVLVMSFDKYNLAGLAGMCLYPAVLSILGDISVRRAFSQLKVILLLVCVIGIANPILDRGVAVYIGSFAVTDGMISMLTLIMKAGFAVFASYLLIVTTSIENICYALRLVHVPKILVTLILLIYRYIILMLKEAERVTQAYSLRAPRQKGIHYKVWGTLAGQMLLRSMDRAELVYESMTLRGFDGEFRLRGEIRAVHSGVGYAVIWGFALLFLRMFPVFEIVGNLFV